MRKILFKIISFSVCIMFFYATSLFAAGWANDGGDNWFYVEPDGTYAVSVIKSSGDDKYYIDENGAMVRDYLLEDYNDSIYYFDDSGKMVRNTWVAVEPTQVYNQMDNPPTIYLYYFGNNGKAYKAKDRIARKTIDGKKYLFNEGGQMLSGWINEDGERYNEYDTEADPFVGFCYFAGDETDGVLREGWSAYEEGSVEDRYYMRNTLWFYFRPGDNKKVQSSSDSSFATKVINGHKYAFDDNGVMVEGWDSDTLDVNNNNNAIRSKQYFMEEGNEVGRMAKREWVFAVPSMKQNLDDHDQEIERWFYSTSGGDIVKGQMRKINNEFYAFNSEGIMKSGLCILDKGTRRYVDSIDAERTDAFDFIVSRHYVSTDKTSGTQLYEIFDDSSQVIFYFDEGNDSENDTVSTFGKRRLGERKVAFADDDYAFASKASGEFEGYKNKRYYQNGIKLKADPALGIGMVFLGYSNSEYGDSVDYKPIYNNSPNSWARPDKNHNGIMSDYMVLRKTSDYIAEGVYPVFAAIDGSGRRYTRNYLVKRDKSKNYWVIGNNATVLNIYEVPVRYSNVNGVWTWQFQSDVADSNGKVKKQWIKFGNQDEYGKTCKESKKDPGDYALSLDDTYCVNFRFADN